MSLVIREQVLGRLIELLQLLPFASVYRNARDLDAVQGPYPAADLLDGDERLVQDVVRMKGVRMPPAIFAMTPQVWIIVQKRATNLNLSLKDATSSPIGPELTSWRDQIVSLVKDDQQLIDIIGGDNGSGQISYLGFETDMAVGRTMVGQILIKLEIRYGLNPYV